MTARRGRPPKPKDEVRKPLAVRLSAVEKAACARTAKRKKMRLSDWMRTTLLSACNGGTD